MRATIFALKRADQATRKAMDEGLAPYGLTSAQLDILLYLDNRDSVAQRALQAALGVTSATLTRVLDGMEARGFVTRRASEDDARVKCVAATPRGCELLDLLHEREEAAFLARFAAGFTADELRILTGWLGRIAANMGDTSQDIFGYGAGETENAQSSASALSDCAVGDQEREQKEDDHEYRQERRRRDRRR